MQRIVGILSLALIALLGPGVSVAHADTETDAYIAAPPYQEPLVARYSTDPAQSSDAIATAIRDAAQLTGVDHRFLMAKARLESGLDASAKAPTSSAAGLFQFIESTWLASIDQYGAEFGLSARVGTAGHKSARGVDPGKRSLSREALLDLRYHPQIAALMAAASTRDNAAILHEVLGRRATHTEVYMAHFLGSAGAARFMRAWQDNPALRAASLFPKAARANRAVFYKNGTARSLDAVMRHFATKIDNAMESIAVTGPRQKGNFAVSHFKIANQADMKPLSYRFEGKTFGPTAPRRASSNSVDSAPQRHFVLTSLPITVPAPPRPSKLDTAEVSSEGARATPDLSRSSSNACPNLQHVQFATATADTKATIVSGIGSAHGRAGSIDRGQVLSFDTEPRVAMDAHSARGDARSSETCGAADQHVAYGCAQNDCGAIA